MPTIQKKVCLLGEFAVGKTSLIRRYVEGKFDDKYLSTIGTKISRKTITFNQELQDTELTLLIWDLAGGEKFDRMMSNYYRGGAGAIIVCDLTRQETLDVVLRYARDFWSVNPGTPLVVVGNKVDLTEELAITPEQLAAAAAECRAPHFTSSAKTGQNVETIFQVLGQTILTTP